MPSGRTVPPAPDEHLPFSPRNHYCLATLQIRTQARIAIVRLVRRMRRLAPASNRPAWQKAGRSRGLKALLVTF